MRYGLVTGLLLFALAGCSGGGAGSEGDPLGLSEPDVRLDVRPGGGGGACAPGRHDLRLERGREALLLVTPPGPTPRRGLLLALHGAGSGGGGGGLWVFRRAWDTPGLVLVAPSSASYSWSLEPRDLDFVERSVRRAFARCTIDPARVAVGGFSAGATLSLWLGLANGDLFQRVVALAPGGSLPRERVGKPKVLVAHGTRDDVIPITAGGDRVVRALRGDGYDVTYRRFPGGHRVPPDLAARAARWALAR